MSQYPSPYTPPPVQPNYGYDFSYYQSTDDLLAPARRASILMFVLGGLTALLGACNLASGLLVPAEQLLAQNQAVLQGQPSPLSASTLQTVSLVMAGLILLVGLALIALGTGVRRGGVGVTIGAIIMAGCIAILLLLMLVISLMGTVGISPIYGVFACISAIPLLLFTLLLWFLVQAARAAPRVAAMKTQHQQQLWQYQQQQQMYQAGYVAPPMPPMQQSPTGYPPPPPPPPVPPPPPSDTSSPGGPDAPSA